MARFLRFKDEDELKAFKERMPAKQQAALLTPPEKRTNKFNAQKVEHDGITFDSKHEGARYLLLKQRMAVGEIRDLKCHVPILCTVAGVDVCTLMVDFIYTERLAPHLGAQFDQRVYEDAKGYKRGAAYALFRLKKKLCEACHQITIDEV